MRKTIIFFEKLNFRSKWIIIFFLLVLPRIIYIYFNSITTADSLFYLEVAENINQGCGFAFTDNLGECQPLSGGYFPAYPYFIWFLKSIGFTDKMIPSLVSILAISSVIYLSNTLLKYGLEEKKIYTLIFMIGFSPISFGYSRYLLIEPVLYIFSVLLLAEFIKLKAGLEYFKFIYLRIILFTILAVLFRPTSIIFIIPHFLITLQNYGIKKFIKAFLSFSLILMLTIIPWGLRDMKYGNNTPFRSRPNNSPVNSEGYKNWVSTFSLTEYEYASAMFPIYNRKSGDRKKIVINTKWNPFISKNDSDLKEIKQILNEDNPLIKRGFTKNEEEIFNQLAKNRIKTNGILGNSFLIIIKSLSLLLHPLNSWGWPLQIGLDAKFSIFNGELITKIFFKLLIFVYRLFLFSLYFKYILIFIRLFNPINLFSQNNYNLIQNNSILIGSLLVLSTNLIMFVGIFNGLEHRYFYPVMPWIEFLVFFKFINHKFFKYIT
ncbi:MULTISPECIES: hypothetical protein [Prochlorococcus]|uniref:Conserved membrane protein n=1 Tax=Prochlorococcus marinus str. MIT 9314 TaxID=167548 RepID=A0A0A2AIB2_PROMR|nr:hypothetical protein [Prochlorococcus marinus]KGG00270.1 Conserved membrane protein [Prochlorococcus marinus str. MIT 9314]